MAGQGGEGPLPPVPKPPGLPSRLDAPDLPDTGGRGRSFWYGLVSLWGEAVGLGNGGGDAAGPEAAGRGRLLDLRRQGSRVYLWGLSFPVWVAWYRYPLPQGGWEWRYVVCTATPRTILTWGKGEFTVRKHFFRAVKAHSPWGSFMRRRTRPSAHFLECSPFWPTCCGVLGADGEGGHRGAYLAGSGPGGRLVFCFAGWWSGGSSGSSMPWARGPRVGHYRSASYAGYAGGASFEVMDT